MSDERRVHLRRESANVLRQVARMLDDPQQRADIETCADEIEASADALERTLPVAGVTPRPRPH
jgi:hypothetical protein